MFAIYETLITFKTRGILMLMNEYASEKRFEPNKHFSNLFKELINSLENLSVQLPFQDTTLVLFSDSSGSSYGGILLSINNEALYNNLKGSVIDEADLNHVENCSIDLKSIEKHNTVWIRRLQPLHV